MSEAVKPLAVGGSKDSHVPSGLQRVMPAREARDHAPGLYRVFEPFSDKYRRLLHYRGIRAAPDSNGSRRVCARPETPGRLGDVFCTGTFPRSRSKCCSSPGRLLANRLRIPLGHQRRRVCLPSGRLFVFCVALSYLRARCNDKEFHGAALFHTRRSIMAITKTTWPTGRSGNPRGRPRSGEELGAILRQMVDRRRFAEKLCELCYAGDVQAMRLLLSYTDGPATGYAEVGGSEGIQITVTYVQTNNRLELTGVTSGAGPNNPRIEAV